LKCRVVTRGEIAQVAHRHTGEAMFSLFCRKKIQLIEYPIAGIFAAAALAV